MIGRRLFPAIVGMLVPVFVQAEAYDALLKRYEKQIRQQERQLKTLRANLLQKEKEALRWEQKAKETKSEWHQIRASAGESERKFESARERWMESRTKADAAEWIVTEHILLSNAADGQVAHLAREWYQRRLAYPRRTPITLADWAPSLIVQRLGEVSQTAHAELTSATEEQAALRLEELRWQDEKQRQTAELDRLRNTQQALWARWQEALRYKTRLEDERNHMEQSAAALRVMLQELRTHRERTVSARQGQVLSAQGLTNLKGTLPWPAVGDVTQNFGRQHASGLKQLLISNGIKIQTGAGKAVRAVQAGKVLFSNTFQTFGRLVIVQHKSGLTSVYGGLVETRVQAGAMVADLEPLGSVGESGSIYFELRREEEPINPLVYLTPKSLSTDLSSRRTFK